MAIENRHFGIVGQSGSGKFELLNYLISQYPFVIIFDNEEEYVDYKTFHNLKDLQTLIQEHNANRRNKFIVRYVPSTKSDEIGQLNILCNMIWFNRKAIQNGTARLKFVIPEIAEYAIPKTFKKWLPLRTLIKRGRKYGIDVCWDTQKLSDCDPIIWGQTRFIYIFHVWGNDEDYIVKKTGPHMLKAIRELEDYEFIKYDTKNRRMTIHEKLEIE